MGLMVNKTGLHKSLIHVNKTCCFFVSRRWGSRATLFPTSSAYLVCGRRTRECMNVGFWTCTLMTLRNTRCRPLCAWHRARECWPRRPCLTSRTDGHWGTATQRRVEGPRLNRARVREIPACIRRLEWDPLPPQRLRRDLQSSRLLRLGQAIHLSRDNSTDPVSDSTTATPSGRVRKNNQVFKRLY